MDVLKGSKVKKLTPMRVLFVELYAASLNATQAAIGAGYSPKTAYSQGQRLLKIVEIQTALASYREIVAKRNDVTIDRIVEEYRRIAFADTTDFVPVRGGFVEIVDTDDLTPEQRAAISEIRQTKDSLSIKFHSKTHALDALAKYMGMISDRNEVNVQVNNLTSMPPPLVIRGVTTDGDVTDGTSASDYMVDMEVNTDGE